MPTKAQLRCISLMGKTVRTIHHVLESVTQEEATTYRDPNDGAEGWTTLEVLCHLIDFDEVVRQRVAMMLAEDNPHYPIWDHDALVTEKAYNRQDLRQAVESLLRSRKAVQETFTTLTDEQWSHTAFHAEYGDYTMTDLVLQVGWHDANHLEQMTRILNQRERA